jgi:adenylate kinase family enzyme
MRLAILGNSGSGKSTLARWASERTGAPCLDLDTIAWEQGQAAVPRDRGLARADVADFCRTHPHWVIEGCYASLVAAALPFGPRLVWLNPGEAQCLANCRARPWEPHKYPAREEQDERLDVLLAWVSAYYTRDGDMSLAAHRALFEAFDGPKVELLRTPPLDEPPPDLQRWLTPDPQET